jgi:hypothetical protein
MLLSSKTRYGWGIDTPVYCIISGYSNVFVFIFCLQQRKTFLVSLLREPMVSTSLCLWPLPQQVPFLSNKYCFFFSVNRERCFYFSVEIILKGFADKQIGFDGPKARLCFNLLSITPHITILYNPDKYPRDLMLRFFHQKHLLIGLSRTEGPIPCNPLLFIYFFFTPIK